MSCNHVTRIRTKREKAARNLEDYVMTPKYIARKHIASVFLSVPMSMVSFQKKRACYANNLIL